MTTTQTAANDTNSSRAYDSGLKAGQVAIEDYDGDLTAEQVETWFAAGTLDPDEALINALNDRTLALVLGLPFAATKSRGEAFRAACERYNQGYRTGARRTVAAL